MSMFNHRHYEAIATVFRDRTPKAKSQYRDTNDVFAGDTGQNYREGFLLMRDLAVMFTDGNPRFDLARWEVACGHEAGVIAVWIPGGLMEAQNEQN